MESQKIEVISHDPQNAAINPLTQLFWATCAYFALIQVDSGQQRSAQGDITTFTHTNNPTTISARWERVSDEEVTKRHVEQQKTKPESACDELSNAAWKIHVWGNGARGSNYLGWCMLGADTNFYSIKHWGDPIIYHAEVSATGSLLIVYGNAIESWFEIRKQSDEGE